MAFRLPVFNTPVRIWRATTPVTDPPDVTTLGNFNVGRRISGGDYWTQSIPKQWYCTMWLLLPMGTNILGDGTTNDQGDTVEVPAGSGRFYHCFFADRSALGFANEHVAAILAQLSSGPPPPPPGGDMLMEDGTDMLMEDGTVMLLE
jgi:hypothetical protein